MPAEERQWWFPVKRYGWGWGPPVVWQGWVVLIVWIIAVVAVSIVTMLPPPRLGLFIISIVALVVLLLVICWMKGEPLRNRPADR